MKARETETVTGTEESGSSIHVEFEGFDDNDKPEVVSHVINKEKVIFIIFMIVIFIIVFLCSLFV